MGIPIKELQSRVSSNELTMYMAYDRIDPSSRERSDLNTGIICSTIAKVHGNKNAKPSDFMIDYLSPEKKEKSVKEMRHIFNMFVGLHGKKK